MLVSLAALSLLVQDPATEPPRSPVAEPDVVVGAEAFGSLDLGVSRLTSGAVVEWKPVAAADVELGAQSATVERGDTVDALLRARGIRPDDYSRAVVAELNPGLDPTLDLAEGEVITLPVQTRLREPPASADDLIAIQPYLGERARLRSETERALSLAEDARTWLPAAESRRLETAVARLERAEREPVRLGAGEIAEDAAAVEAFNRLLESAQAVDASEAVAAAASATAALRRSGGPHPGSLFVVAPPTETPVDGICEVAWSVAGFSALPGSVSYSNFPARTGIRVPVSHLEVWLTRGRVPLSDVRLRVNRDQLRDADGHRLTVATNGACGA